MRHQFSDSGAELTIEIDGKAMLHVGSFLEIIGTTLSVLSALSRRLDVEEGFRDWKIVDLSRNSPGRIVLAAPTRERRSSSAPIVTSLLDGMSRLNEVAEPPPYFDELVMGRLLKLVRPLSNGVSLIKFSFDKIQVRPTLNLAANINTIDERVNHIHRAWTSMEGRLESVSVHGKFPKFTIYDVLTNDGTECYFDDEDLEEVKDALPGRVEVYGLATYRSRAAPTQIDVLPGTLKKFPPSNALPQFGDFKIDLTKGEDSAEYIDRMREEDD